MTPTPAPRILLTGATGYVGGRLLRRMQERGDRVRCPARNPDALAGRGGEQVEAIRGDLLEPGTLDAAFAGIETAYYLAHSLGATGDFEQKEREAARNFAAAAGRAGVRRIVYLGGLCDEAAPLSSHMRSRLEVGRRLRESGAAVIEFRASIILGSGSLSFELIRALVHRLPVMITPRWVSVRSQPIAINDVLDYLTAPLDLGVFESRVYEIGGADVVSYIDLMREYAGLRGLRRRFIRVPVLTPHLSSLWLGLVTPLYARVGRRLIDSITTPSVVHDPSALRDFAVRPLGVRAAIEQALRNEDREYAETYWADALSAAGPRRAWGGVRFGRRLVDSRTARVNASPEAAFVPIRRIGGKNGWYYADGLWWLRGVLDRAVGGVGMRRGRRDADHLRAGDVVDCWRVERCEPPHLLILRAEMRLPGRAWLRFDIEPDADGCVIRQTALFDPIGLLGHAYWYALYPLHQIVFAGMLRALTRLAAPEEVTFGRHS